MEHHDAAATTAGSASANVPEQEEEHSQGIGGKIKNAVTGVIGASQQSAWGTSSGDDRISAPRTDVVEGASAETASGEVGGAGNAPYTDASLTAPSAKGDFGSGVDTPSGDVEGSSGAGAGMTLPSGSFDAGTR